MNTYANNFHATSARCRLDREGIQAIVDTAPGNRTPAERATIRRLWRKLCGIKGCTCGNEAGIR
jgi:hypothetical protein